MHEIPFGEVLLRGEGVVKAPFQRRAAGRLLTALKYGLFRLNVYLRRTVSRREHRFAVRPKTKADNAVSRGPVFRS